MRQVTLNKLIVIFAFISFSFVSTIANGIGLPAPGDGDDCPPFQVCGTMQPPPAPTSVSVPSTSTSGSYTLTWNGITTLGDTYQIEESSVTSSFSSLATVSYRDKSYSITSKSDNSYTYRVRACRPDEFRGVKCSAWTNSNTINLKKKPSTPSKPADKNSTSTSYSISWSKPSGTVTYYDVQEKVGSGSWAAISSGQTGTSISRSGKANNTTYYYRVRACNRYSWSCSSFSSQNTVRVELKPSTPSTPVSINSTSTSVTISWSKPSGTINFYQVQERVAGGSWSTIASSHTSTSITRTGRANSTNYEYRVAACNSYSWSCSGYSGANSVKVRLIPSVPAAPSKPSTSTGSAAVSWSKPSGTVTYYDLQKRNNNGSWVTAKSSDTGTSETVSGLTDGAWDFRVRACNGYSWACSGYSAASSDTTVRVKPSTPSKPSVPASDGNGSYSVSWSKPSGTVTVYDLLEYKNGSSSYTVVANDTTALTKSLSGRGDGTYTYRVRACNQYSWACSSYSSHSSTLTVLHKPGTPSSITNPSTDADGNISVSWGTGSGQVSEYRLEEQFAGSWTQVQSGNTATSKSRSLGNGTYHYRVRACNTTGCSGFRTTSSVTEIRIRPAVPAAPTVPSTSTGSASISWSSVGNATYYDLQKRHNNGSWVTAKSGDTNTSETVGGLTEGDWDFRVRACNTRSWSCSSYSAASSKISVRMPPSTPTAPTTSVSQTTSGSYSINWTKPSGVVTSYDLQERLNNGSWSTIAQDTSALTKSVSGKGTGDYDYQVRACNESNCSGYSAVSTDVKVRRIPSTPSINSPSGSSDGDGKFTVGWGATSGATYYDLQRRVNNGSWSTIASKITSTSYAESVSTTGNYEYRVRACNSESWACSGYSSVKSIDFTHTPDYAAKYSGNIPDASFTSPVIPSNDVVGALNGSGGVSGGASTYDIPIVVPPGRAGMQPNLAISYSSRTGNSNAGVGWGVTGGSRIYRCGQTQAQDGDKKKVRYSQTDDRLCYGGQRLIKIDSGGYGTSGSVYRTELDMFARISQLDGGINDTSTRFKVEHKDGRIEYFGWSSQSRQIAEGKTETLAWLIEKVEDRSVNKNNMTYHYSNVGGGEYLLSSIKYTGDVNGEGDREVVYEYIDRKNYSSSYLAGGLTRDTKIVSNIKTYVGSETVRNYKLDYLSSAASGRDLLSSVTGCAYEGATEVCLPATSFNWSNTQPSFELQKTGYKQNGTLVPQIQWFSLIESVAPRADVNGDGVLDWRSWFQNAEGELVSTHENLIRPCVLNKYSYTRNCTNADFNIDGKTDFIQTKNGIFEIGYSNGQSVPSYFDSGLPWQRKPIENITYINDFNGDGLPDVVIERSLNKPYSTAALEGELYLYLHNGDFTRPYSDNGQLIYTFQTVGEMRNEKKRITSIQFVGDMDGNGIPDFIESTSLETEQDYKIEVPFIQPKPKTLYYLNRNTSDNFSKNALDISSDGAGSFPGDERTFVNLFIDINNDGLKDWIDSPNTYRLNNGQGFNSTTFRTGNWQMPMRQLPRLNAKEAPEIMTFDNWFKYAGNAFQTDYDNDGDIDFIVPTGYAIESCAHVHVGPNSTPTELCGDELYEPVRDQTPTYALTTVDTTLYDRGVFKYGVVKFEEGADGRIAFNVYDTGIVGTANHTRALDGFGNGLTDYVFTFQNCVGIGNIECRFRNVTTPMTDVESGVYILRNRGAASGDDYLPQDLLQSVTNGLGVKEEWTLKPLSSEAYSKPGEPFYQAENGYLASQTTATQESYFNFASNNYVVAEHKVSSGFNENGQELLNSTFYRYKEALYNREGRGFMGFRTIIVDSPAYLDAQKDVKYSRTVTNFHQIFPLTGKVENSSICFAVDGDTCGNNPISKNEFKYEVFETAQSSVDDLVSTWIVNTENRSTEYAVNNRHLQKFQQTLSTSTLDIDNYGNVLKQTKVIDTGTGLLSSVTNHIFDYSDVDSWWVNKVQSSRVSSEKITGDTPQFYQAALDSRKVIESTFTYYPASRKIDTVSTNVIEGGGLSSTLKTYYEGTAGNYGLPTKTVTSSGGESRTSSTEYSTDYYFISKIKNALNHATTTTHFATNGQPHIVTEPNGNQVINSYDAFGRISEVASNLQPTTYYRIQNCSSTCNEASAVYKEIIVQAGEPEQTIEKDKFGRALLGETEGFNGDPIYSYTRLNRLGQKEFDSVASYDRNTTLGSHYLAYDILGRLTHREVDTASGRLKVELDYEVANPASYYGQQFQTKITVNDTNVMYRAYNGYGNLLETIDAMGGITAMAFDNKGNPIVMRDANGNELTGAHNALGQKLWVKDPNMGTKTFTYSNFGELKTETDANGDTYRYQYDDLGRIKNRFLNESLEASFVYDQSTRGGSGICVGLPTSETSNNSNSFSRRYEFDSKCRLTNSITTIDGQSYTTKTHYDGNYGRIKGTTFASGITMENWYNSTGYLTHQLNAASDYIYHEARTISESNNVLQQTSLKANGLLTEVQESYVGSGQMKSIYTHASGGAGQRHRISYTYDSFGNLQQQYVETTQNSGVLTSTENYQYDDLHRLVWSQLNINGNSSHINYDYDAVGNLKRKDDYGTNFIYGDKNKSNGNAGPNAIRQLTKAGGGIINYNYDNNGNLLSGDGKSISYNAFNKPLSISRNGVTSSFYYGSDQMRYKQVKTGRSGGTETTTYAEAGYQIIQYNGKVIKKTFMGDTIVTETESNNLSDFGIGFVHKDRLGSVVTVTDELGNVSDNKSYDPFGKPRKPTMEQADDAKLSDIAWRLGFISSNDATELPTRDGFTGHEHLDDAELIHMNGRVYDYNMGRFLSVDPFIQSPTNSQSMNPYSYIMNNPLSGTDPSGYISERRDFLGEMFGVSDPFGAVGGCRSTDCRKKERLRRKLRDTCKEGDEECRKKAKEQFKKLLEKIKSKAGANAEKNNGSDTKDPSEQKELTEQDILSGNFSLSDIPTEVWKDTLATLLKDLLPGSGLAEAFQAFRAGKVGEGVIAVLGELPWGKVFKAAKKLKNLAKNIRKNFVAYIKKKKEITRGKVALDNNTLIAAIERGESGAVDATIAGRVPIVSRQAAREFLVKGDKNELKKFLSERGGRIAKSGSQSDVDALVQRAAAAGRSTKIKDIRVAASAQKEGVSVITRDKRFSNMLNEFDIGAEAF